MWPCIFAFGIFLWMPLVTPQFGFADQNSADHEALRRIRNVYEEAVNSNQLEMLRPYLAPHFSVVTFTDTEFDDFEKFKSQWQVTREKMLKGGSYTVKLNPDRSVIIEDFALAKGNAENTLIDGDGNKFVFSAHWTALLQKIDGEWRILRGHNSLSPFTNPMIKHGVKKKLLHVFILAFLSGVLLAVLIVRIIWGVTSRKGR